MATEFNGKSFWSGYKPTSWNASKSSQSITAMVTDGSFLCVHVNTLIFAFSNLSLTIYYTCFINFVKSFDHNYATLTETVAYLPKANRTVLRLTHLFIIQVWLKPFPQISRRLSESKTITNTCKYTHKIQLLTQLTFVIHSEIK